MIVPHLLEVQVHVGWNYYMVWHMGAYCTTVELEGKSLAGGGKSQNAL